MSKGTRGAGRSEVLQGTLDLMILKALQALGPLHGYGIARRIEQVSEEVLQLNEGTVYTSLLRLQQQGWISARRGAPPRTIARRRFYAITKSGRSSWRARPRTGSASPASSAASCACRGSASMPPGFACSVARGCAAVRRESAERRLRRRRCRAAPAAADGALRRAGHDAGGGARIAARRQFGNTTRLQEDRREIADGRPRSSIAWRTRAPRPCASCGSARRSPRQPSSRSALGIGLTTAVFTLLDQLVLRLLPVAEPERLVMIWSTGPNLGDTRGPRASSFPLCQDYQRAGRGVRRRVLPLLPRRGDHHRRQHRARAAPSSSRATTSRRCGVGPGAGPRVLGDADDRVDSGHPVVVLSHRYWRDRFGGDPAIVGRKVLVNRQPMEVVGVAAAGFNGIDAAQAPQIWLPVRMKALMTPGEDGLNDRHYHFVQLFGRLQRGYTADSARASLQPLFHQFLEAGSAGPGHRQGVAVRSRPVPEAHA